jgi:hypothetical protein
VSNPESKLWLFLRGCLTTFFILFILTILAGIAGGPIGPGNQRMAEGAALQKARSINLLLFSYSNDNYGHYPEGKSSTEVFQKLIDEKYCNDSTLFYIPRSGKTCPQPGEKLKPENVCFDVTEGLDSSSSDMLPVAFTTGYRVAYVPNTGAFPLKASPQFSDSRSWLGWIQGEPTHWDDPGIAVSYKSNNSFFIRLETSADGQASIPNFISPDYKPDGKTYIQLTPDGPLSQ